MKVKEIMKSNRRRGERSQMTVLLPVYDQDQGQQIGHVIDISAGGMMLLSDGPMPLDRQFHLKIMLPEPVLEHTEIYLEAQTLWSRPGVNPSVHETGLQLLDLYDSAADVIQELGRRSYFRPA